MIVMKANVALRVDASVMNPNNVKDPAVRIQYAEFSSLHYHWSRANDILL